MSRNVANSDMLNIVQLAPGTATQPTIVPELLASTTLILLTPVKIGLKPTHSLGETSLAHSPSSVSHLGASVGQDIMAHSTQPENYQPSPSEHISNSITNDLSSESHLSTTPTSLAEEHPS